MWSRRWAGQTFAGKQSCQLPLQDSRGFYSESNRGFKMHSVLYCQLEIVVSKLLCDKSSDNFWVVCDDTSLMLSLARWVWLSALMKGNEVPNHLFFISWMMKTAAYLKLVMDSVKSKIISLSKREWDMCLYSILNQIS